MVVERKPLQLPPPVIFSPRPVHTTLGNAHIPPPVRLPPTPPPPPFDPTIPLPTAKEVFASLQDESVGDLETNGHADKGSSKELDSSSKEDSYEDPMESFMKPSLVELRAKLKRARTEQGSKKNTQTPQYDFVYADRDTFENELNEFYSFQDQGFIKDGRDLFHASFCGAWNTATNESKATYVRAQLDRLELRDAEERERAAKQLLYIAQGVFLETTTKQTHIESIRANCKLLMELGALEYFFGALKVASATVDYISRTPESQLSGAERQLIVDVANRQTSICFSLMYLLVEVNYGSDSLAVELMDTSPSVPTYLLGLIAQLAEGNRKHYPVKKLLLLLWKVLLVTIGDTAQLEELKTASRLMEALPPAKDVYLKSTPQDYFQFHSTTMAKFPAYVLPDSVSGIHAGLRLVEPLSVGARRQLQIAPVLQPFIPTASCPLPRYFVEATELYARKNYISLGLLQLAKERERVEREEAQKTFDGGLDAIKDLRDSAEDVSDTSSHFGSERKKDLYATRNFTPKTAQKISKRDLEALKRIETLYQGVLPNMATYVGMLIRLLYYVNLGNGGFGTNQGDKGSSAAGSSKADQSEEASSVGEMNDNGRRDDNDQNGEDATSILEKWDLERHKEVVSKAVSAILLILMKSLKCHHVLKFEYLSQILVDNNCAILILKMLSTWLQNAPPATTSPTAGAGNANPGEAGGVWKPQEPPSRQAATPGAMAAAWLKARDSPEDLNFFHFCRSTNTPANGSKDVDPKPAASASTSATLTPTAQTPPTETTSSCFRNFFTSINLLRILQKLTKRKTHRILALVQWKASAVLKRVIKINHVGLQLYALKLLKSQVPFLGKKWRSSNMKVITAIFMHLRPYLRDEWLNGDADVDVEEALAQEQQLRSLILSYHTHRYDTIFLRQRTRADSSEDTDSHVDELDLILSISRRGSIGSDGDSFDWSKTASLKSTWNDHLALDENFMENYEEWLRSEVYEPSDLMETYPGEQPGNGVTGDVVPRSLFSATETFNKGMLSNYYDDIVFAWDNEEDDKDEPLNMSWADIDEWDEEFANSGAFSQAAADWGKEPVGMDMDIDSEDSGLGSWSDDGEGSGG
ncbi:hypothetical protein BC832DRAFT_612171 [Gaertneriomyces semiglobifer]|nr:hypothetical protein BC832DRAFT_612171 [Gaertneriomyces semiglobifer]